MLDNAACLERHKLRGRKIEEKQLTDKFKRNFPDDQLKYIIKHKLKYYLLDMSKDIKSNAEIVREIISSNLYDA